MNLIIKLKLHCYQMDQKIGQLTKYIKNEASVVIIFFFSYLGKNWLFYDPFRQKGDEKEHDLSLFVNFVIKETILKGQFMCPQRTVLFQKSN